MLCLWYGSGPSVSCMSITWTNGDPCIRVKELQSKTRVIKGGEYVVAKQDVDHLPLEFGQ